MLDERSDLEKLINNNRIYTLMLKACKKRQRQLLRDLKKETLTEFSCKEYMRETNKAIKELNAQSNREKQEK